MTIEETPDLHDSEIQGDVLPGFRVRRDKTFTQQFSFFTIADGTAARRGLALLVRQISSAKAVRREALAAAPIEPAVNTAFTWAGLEALGLDQQSKREFANHKAFKEGLWRRTRRLPDLLGTSTAWQIGDGDVHVLVNVGGVDSSEVRRSAANVEAQLVANGFRVQRPPVEGVLLPGDVEAFGFADGLSRPLVDGYHKGTGGRQTLADNPAAYPTDLEVERALRQATIDGSKYSTALRDAEREKLQRWLKRRRRERSEAARFAASITHFSSDGRPFLPPNRFVVNAPTLAQRPTGFATNGSFMVWVRFVQHRDRFEEHCKAMAKRLAAAWGRRVTPNEAAALMVGRRKDGTSMVVRPLFKRSNRHPPDEDFRYLPDDSGGQACPLASHARKMNPRTIENLRHAVLRRGIPFHTDTEQGLLFVCYQSSIEEQYETLQRYWANRSYKPEPNASPDPLIAQELRSRPGHIEIRNIKSGGSTPVPVHNDWIEPTGGLYLFAPSIPSLRLLARVSA